MQVVQNNVASVIVIIKKKECFIQSFILKELRCLPVDKWISSIYKFSSLVFKFKTLKSDHPQYLRNIFETHRQEIDLRIWNGNPCKTFWSVVKLANGHFILCFSLIWNCLPSKGGYSETIEIVISRFKCYLSILWLTDIMLCI